MGGCAKQPSTIPLSNEPAGIAVDDANHTLYVSGESGSVAVIDTSSCNGTEHQGCMDSPTLVPVGTDARGATFDSSTSTLYVADAGSNTVSMLETTRCNASTTAGCKTLPKAVPVGSSPRRIVIGDASDTAYVVNVLGNNVSLLSTQTCNADNASGCPTAHPVDVSSGGGSGISAGVRLGRCWIGRHVGGRCRSSEHGLHVHTDDEPGDLGWPGEHGASSRARARDWDGRRNELDPPRSQWSKRSPMRSRTAP